MSLRSRHVRMPLVVVGLLASLLGSAPAPALDASLGPPIEVPTPASAAAPEADSMGDLGPAPRTPIVELAPITPVKPHSVGQKLSREVFGYLPYWELNAATERYLRYDLLTTIAFFGVPINPNGS